MYSKNRNNSSPLSLLVVLTLVAVSFGYFIGQTQIVCDVCPPQDLDFSLFWEAYRKIEQAFVDPAKINKQDIVFGAISGMVESLDDPYTVFFNPEDTQKFLEDIAGKFEGVGMEIGIRDKGLQVIAPLEGTPAQEAGIRAGDRIIKINGELTTEITLDQAVSTIRGPKGTEVVLTMFRDDWDAPKDIAVTRGVIEIPSLRWEQVEQDIAYVKLYQFSEKAGLDFTQAAIEILASDSQKIILDLRNNPGGYLEVSTDIAGFFLSRGQVVVIEDMGGEQKEYKANGNSVFLDYPIVVLINEGSASASEILAGALRDNRDIKLIGQNSFGKGSVQRLEKLRGGSSLKITIAKWLTPNGETISDVGLEPNVKVEITEQDYEQGNDPQLDKAIEILKNL